MSDAIPNVNVKVRGTAFIFFFLRLTLILSPLFPLPKLKTVLQRSLSKFYEIVYPKSLHISIYLPTFAVGKTKRVETANARENVVTSIIFIMNEPHILRIL